MPKGINIFNFVPSTTGVVQTEFIMLVKTDNAGTSASNQFTIPTAGAGYNYDVDWGDGTTSTAVTGSITHTFPSAGNYVVKISGAFPLIYFNNGGDKLKLLEIQNWGNIAWSTFSSAFMGCSNMDVTATDVPDLSSVTNFQYCFFGNTSLIGNSSFSNWDVSNVTNMRGLFRGASSFNQLLNWDVSNATTFLEMFFDASSFNQPLNWDVSSVTVFTTMFFGASSFNQNLSAWQLNTALSSVSNTFRNSGMSTDNYTDTIVGWANYTITNGAPYNVNMTTQTGMIYDTSRSGGANFADAGAARIYLTTSTPTGAGWTISGDVVI